MKKTNKQGIMIPENVPFVWCWNLPRARAAGRGEGARQKSLGESRHRAMGWGCGSGPTAPSGRNVSPPPLETS